jgi:hypothetical protein
MLTFSRDALSVSGVSISWARRTLPNLTIQSIGSSDSFVAVEYLNSSLSDEAYLARLWPGSKLER